MDNRKTFLERNWLPLLVAALVTVFIVFPVAWQYAIVPTVIEQNANEGQDIADDAIDSEKALNDYREFRSLWFEIKAQHAQTENYKQSEEQFHETYGDDPSEWSRTAETRHGRIHDRIIGSQNQEEMLISEYNAMQADATTAIYRCGLPNRVDKKLFISDGTGVSYTSQEARNTTPPEDPSQCELSTDGGDAINES